MKTPTVLCGVAILTLFLSGYSFAQGKRCGVAPDVKRYIEGYYHDCTLLCTDVTTGSTAKIKRPGRNADYSAVCKELKTMCDAGRSAACANTAAWMNTTGNEPQYIDCEPVRFGPCKKGCAFE